ncbi:uncharacterized protein LOC108326916 isoform X2 [Vigna angularis]|nr:uncharacterized protein LOC108326916 isoform X2 [Vigna angularis]
MLRSASGDNSAGSSTSRSDWKLKQDTEDFRVMYREGPEGTPFHTLLVEGYVDGPLDLSLCLSWESFLYKKWWPQFTIPSFKVLVSERLQRVQIGEHISLVRMKVPWPLSTREAIVHYYLFEYFQDDLVVVLLNTVSESTSIDNFNMDAIPEAKDVVRIDLLGGYAMQKVTSERSYFRIIGNLDIKLDFVPPSLINFISRQLIGSGFRLYQKAVASMLGNDKDKDISKALEDPLYVRIREALVIGEELKQDASFVPAEELIQSEQNGVKDKDISCEYMSNQRAGGEEDVEAGCEEIVRVEEDVNKVLEVPIEEGDSLSVLINGEGNGEIEGADNEEIVEIEKEMIKVSEIPTEKNDARSVLKDKMNGYVRSDVRRALDTIERVISTVKEHGFHSRRPTSNSEKVDTVDSSSAKPIQVCLKDEDGVKESSSNIREETSEEPAIQSFRQTETNPNLKEVNHKKVEPASPDHSLSRTVEVNQIDSYSLKNGTTVEQTISDNKQLNNYAVQDISSEDMKKSTREIRYRYCCFMS